jgi:hypothetical protein
MMRTGLLLDLGNVKDRKNVSFIGFFQSEITGMVCIGTVHYFFVACLLRFL